MLYLIEPETGTVNKRHVNLLIKLKCVQIKEGFDNNNETEEIREMKDLRYPKIIKKPIVKSD